MENKELTEIDRQLIASSRSILALTQTAVDQMKKGNDTVVEMVANVWVYNKDILKQLTEARSVADFSGIGLHETRRALEAAKENLVFLKSSDVLDSALNWLVSLKIFT